MIQQVLWNDVQAYNLQDKCVDEDDPFKGILTLAYLKISYMYHTIKDKITRPVSYYPRCDLTHVYHSGLEINMIEQAEKDKYWYRGGNRTHIDYDYQVGDCVMLRINQDYKCKTKYKGPLKTIKIWTNGTSIFQIWATIDIINVCLIKPYH